MWDAILVLTRAQLLIMRNTFWRGKLGRKIGIVALLVAVAFGAWLLFNLMSSAAQLLTSQEFADLLEQANRQQPGLGIPTDFRPFLEALPSVVLFSALVVLVLSSFSNLLASLYLAGDMDMLLVAPVPMRAVFVVKFFGGLIIPYLLLLVLLGPALIGFGRGLGYGVAYYLVTPLVLALFPLLPAGLSALLVMVVVRVIPARRAREIVGVLSGLIGVGWYVVSQFSREIAPQMASVQTLDSLRRLNLPVLPSAWAGRALVAAGAGDWLTLLFYGGLFVAVSIGVFAGCAALAERLYYAGWANMAAQGGKIRTRAKGKGRQHERSALAPGLFALLLPLESQAILYKDLRVFPRDLRNMQQLIFPLVLAGIWTFQLLRGDSGAYGPNGLGSSLGMFASAGISFFICLNLSNVMAGSGISREGRGFWLLKIAPISAWRLLLGKLALAYLPFPVAGTILVALLAILQGSTLGEGLHALALVLLVGLGTTSITLGLGAAFPKFDWVNPNQQNSLRAGCLAPILYMLYILAAAGTIFGLPALAVFAPGWGRLLALAGWLICIGMTAAVAWGALAFGAARLEQVEVG